MVSAKNEVAMKAQYEVKAVEVEVKCLKMALEKAEIELKKDKVELALEKKNGKWLRRRSPR